jgi:hypothetical protein
LGLQLWHAYLSERLVAVRGLGPHHPAVQALNNTFERAMVSMHKMPRIWIMYLEFVLGQSFITRTRRLFDRALTSLPVTQHERIWPLYLRFIGQPGIPMETAVRVYRRYLKLEPTHAEEFIAYLRIKQLWGEAAKVRRRRRAHTAVTGCCGALATPAEDLQALRMLLLLPCCCCLACCDAGHQACVQCVPAPASRLCGRSGWQML